jgi:CheY-like chemotaxis protein
VTLRTSLSVAEQLRAVSDRVSNVLVVDDLEANGNLMVRLLSRDGYRMRVARDGREALDAIALEQPDVILMDVLMPRLDGFESVPVHQDDPATRLIPVVLRDRARRHHSRIRASRSGRRFHLDHSGDRELRARVRSLLRIKHYTDELDSAESVILSLALTMRRGTAAPTATASGWPASPPRLAAPLVSSCIRLRRCSSAATFTTSARSVSLTTSCSNRDR